MGFQKLKTWDNRTSGRMLANGKTWTRRITWLENEDAVIKLKLEDGDTYLEQLAHSRVDAEMVWSRFKEGQSLHDCLSIFTKEVPAPMQSRRAAAQGGS